MANPLDFFELAQLAEASYAKFDQFDADKVKDALVGDGEGFSFIQADLFLANWQIVSGGHRPNTDSGYSSTLFKSTDPSGGYVLAFRGTEPGAADLLSADGSIVMKPETTGDRPRFLATCTSDRYTRRKACPVAPACRYPMSRSTSSSAAITGKPAFSLTKITASIWTG